MESQQPSASTRSSQHRKLVRKNTLNRPDHWDAFNKHSMILHSPSFNKGTAFSAEERNGLGLRGLLPPVVETIDVQLQRTLLHLRSFALPIDRFIYLQSLKDRNETLFYRLAVDHLEEVMPLIYTPTVGEACEKFGLNWRHAEGMFFSTSDKGQMRSMLDNWPVDAPHIIVVTDGSRILGLGDLGANGMGIPIGKLSLYVAAGGFHPIRTLPVMLDFGTNNPKLLQDPLYIGVRSKRVEDEQYYALVDEFLMAVKDKWPKCLVQFEDFSNNHCFELLERYRNKLLCFNDDIQGTGAVVAAGFVNAARMSGKPLQEQKLVFFGAGSAGIGVADMIVAMMVEEGMTAEDARKQFWLVDSQGLVTKNRGDKLAAHKVPYARSDNGDVQLKNLLEVVKHVKPTALVGLAGVSGGEFTPEILKELASFSDRPIVFALSNPTSKAECTAHDAYVHSEGRAIFASGSPFEPVEYNGKTLFPGQGNNMYIFPGLGFGAVIADATRVTDGMISAAARALARCVTEEEIAAGRVYPKLDRIRSISATVAAAVVERAFEEGVAQIERPDNLLAQIEGAMYYPDYLELTSAAL